MEDKQYSLIIIGSGPAGLCAAVYARRANLKTLIIKGGNPGGQLMGTSYVENWPGIIRIKGPELMQHMFDQVKNLEANFVNGEVKKVNFSQQPFTVETENEKFSGKAIIIATGAHPKKLKCPGEEKYWGKGITSCAVCDAPFYKDKKVLIVGGGDSAMEDASFLRNFTSDITIIQIEEELTASHAMQKRVIHDPAIKIIYNSTVTGFHGNDTLKKATISNKKTGEETEIDVDGVFIAIGLTPNTAPFKDQLELNKWGYIKVTDTTHTSIEGVFAAGDVFDYRYRQAVTAAGMGCMAALDAERYLKNRKTNE